MNNLSPIILTVYNRPEHTKRTVEALKANTLASKSILYIFSDASKGKEDIKNVEQVREYIHSIKGFKEIHIIERKKNMGLANNIINCVTEIINRYGKMILLEDDLVSSPVFLEYMNNMLNKYKDQKKIFSVTGFGYPETLMKIPSSYEYDIYFSPRTASWSWGTWKDRWEKADWEIKDFEEFKKNKLLQKKFGEDKAEMLIRQMNGEIDSWAIRWDYTHFKNDVYCVFPIRSYIENIGMDGSGVHCSNDTKFNQVKNLSNIKNPRPPDKISLDERIVANFRRMFRQNPFKNFVYKSFKNTIIYKYYKNLKSKK